jgi:hypothetical protein
VSPQQETHDSGQADEEKQEVGNRQQRRLDLAAKERHVLNQISDIFKSLILNHGGSPCLLVERFEDGEPLLRLLRQISD